MIVAVVAPTFVAAPVTMPGASEVENVLSLPYVVPPELEATSRKWYVVDFFKPVTEADSLTVLVPEPALLTAVFEP